MICMRVCIENRVDSFNRDPESLKAKIGGSVNQYPVLVQFDQYAGTKAFIAGIVGDACLAMAADHRNADAGARSEDHDRCVLEIIEHLVGFGPFPAARRDDERWFVARLRSTRLRTGALLQLVQNLDIAETKFGKPVLQKPLLLDREIAPGLLIQDAKQVQ